MKCHIRIATIPCVYDEGHRWPHLCRRQLPGEPLYNGQMMARFLASCPGDEVCSCGSPMRADGSRCTRRRCPEAT